MPNEKRWGMAILGAAQSLTNGYGDNASSEPIQPMHKKSKRSLDDADLSDQGELSPPSSPG